MIFKIIKISSTWKLQTTENDYYETEYVWNGGILNEESIVK